MIDYKVHLPSAPQKSRDDSHESSLLFFLGLYLNHPGLYYVEMHFLGNEIYSFVRNDIDRLRNKIG